MAAPPSFIQALPIETEATDGDIVTFQVKVSSDPSDPTSVSWWRCGDSLRPIAGRREVIEHGDGWHELILSNVSQDDEGEYECRAENDRGHNSCFGSLFYYHEGGGTLTDVTGEGLVTEGDGRQSGLLILIDDGSQTEGSLSEQSDRMTVSEQMQGIIEDLTQSSQGERTGSLTFEKEDENQFDSDIEDLADDDLESHIIQNILGMAPKKEGSVDTLVPEMPSPDLQVDVAFSEGASNPYAPSVLMEHQKFRSNPNNVSKKKRVKVDEVNKEDTVIWPPEAALVTFDLPVDTATTSVEIPFARGSSSTEEGVKGSSRCAGADTPFDVADITEEAVDFKELDGSTKAVLETESSGKIAAALREISTLASVTQEASQPEQDSSFTSVTDITGEALLSEGFQPSKMSYTRSSYKSSSYQYTDDGMTDTTTSLHTGSVTSRATFGEESVSMHQRAFRSTRKLGDLEDDVVAFSTTAVKKSRISSSSAVEDVFMSEAITEGKSPCLILSQSVAYPLPVKRRTVSDMYTINSLLLCLDKKLEEDNKFNETLKKVQKATGIERRKLVLGSSFVLGALVIIGYGAQLICNGIGFVYPAYASILAIESRNKDDDTLWLTYWVVFAALSIVEFFSEIILALIPFYWLLKCMFLIWCFLPWRLNGSKFIYHRFIRPVFLSHLEAPEGTQENADGEEHEKSS